MKMIGWNVYKPKGTGERWVLIDTVYFLEDIEAEDVRKCLIEHDGYQWDIMVEKSERGV